MLNAVAASGQFIVEHVYSYLKHSRLELTHKYECSDVIILPKSVFQLMDEPKYVELSAVKQVFVNSNGSNPQGQFRTISNSIMKGQGNVSSPNNSSPRPVSPGNQVVA